MALKNGIQWWYNWSPQPEADIYDSYQDVGIEFVPMAWDENFDETRLRTYLSTHPDVKYLLGFNEPNFREQANLTPAQVAQYWPKLEAIAADFNLKIVGPAVNFSPGQVDIPGTDDDSSPFEFLDAFFEACPDCQVDYIAVHCYMNNAPAVQWFVSEFASRYERPVWLTEWASWDDGGPANVNEQMNYLATTTRWLENNPNVYRYSWFIGRGNGKDVFPFLDILDGDGELTPLGGLYTHIPATGYRFLVNQRFQAEGGHQGEGYVHQPTTDTSGYVDIVWTSDNGYVDFEMNNETVDGTDKIVDVVIRVANGGDQQTLDLMIDNERKAALTIPNTGADDHWQNVTTQVSIPSGEHTFTIKTRGQGYAINWIELTEQ
ncbi:hypothetical Protein YC6258_04599 [Gynuella sunshinyii YC6258]|uniref:CBM6 domain-containing protein n=1 Tax=Gynuella sunshinyii YC6258 TaxID=1445510 RepID=A0A0C5VQU8_9GAMM|nr:hypothetical Protein YC6258_04599 [Gynuella sunshinyii YC6258]